MRSTILVNTRMLPFFSSFCGPYRETQSISKRFSWNDVSIEATRSWLSKLKAFLQSLIFRPPRYLEIILFFSPQLRNPRKCTENFSFAYLYNDINWNPCIVVREFEIPNELLQRYLYLYIEFAFWNMKVFLNRTRKTEAAVESVGFNLSVAC